MYCKSKITSGIYAINTSKHILSERNLKTLYYSLVHAHLLYGIQLWGNAYHNKAIRDGKYLACHMPVLGNVQPIKIENVDIFFRDVISLLARVVILLIDTATQEVPMKNI